MVQVIAEIGSNHLGLVEEAKRLIAAAKNAGCQVAKFQAFDESIWTPLAWAKRKHLAMGPEFFAECANVCAILGIEFMCTPCYPEAVEWLNPLVKRWKIASADVGHGELIEAVRATVKPILVSTGFAWAPLWAIPLHCVVSYPASPASYGLNEWLHKVGILREWGLSDHTVGIGTAVAAVALGASIVEKHFALPESVGPDAGVHAARPREMARLVEAVQQAEEAVGGQLGEPRVPQGRKVWYPG